MGGGQQKIFINCDKKVLEKEIASISRGYFKLAVSAFPARYQASIIDAVDLTSVFGMGTGVALQLFPPEIFESNLANIFMFVSN